MRTLIFLNMKGGVGKTTSSLNVATGLAMKGKKTLFIDFDPQSNSTSILVEDKPEIAINDLLFNIEQTNEAILEVEKNLDVIPASLSLAEAEKKLVLNSNVPQHNRLSKIIDQAKRKRKYDYVIIDCPPILNTLTINAVLAATDIIIPIHPDKFAVDGFSITLKNIQELQENFECNGKVKVLFTIVNRNNAEKAIIEHIKNSGVDTYNTTIRSQPKPIKVGYLNNTPVIKDKKAKVGADYIELVSEILEVN